MTHTSVGFTGTRRGMIKPQLERMHDLLVIQYMDEFHHGDCVGADAQAHDIVTDDTGAFIAVHPPKINKNRAFCIGHVIHEPKDYMARNEDIVNASTIMFAAPKGMSEDLRSGTWHAIRYAIRQKKPVVIVWPNGKVEQR